MELKYHRISSIYLIVIATYSIIFFGDDFIRFIGREDGPIENLGAIFFLLAMLNVITIP